MFDFIRYIFTGPLLAEQNQQLAENLAKERRAREADRVAWERKCDEVRKSLEARIAALSDRMLYMAGVPTTALPSAPVEDLEAAVTSPSALPGAASYELDVALESYEDEQLKRYWQDMQSSVAAEIESESNANA